MSHGVATVDLLQLLWRRKVVLLLSGLVTGVIALYIAILLPPGFIGEGLLLVEAREPQIPELAMIATNPPASSPRNRTESDVLRSRALIETVVRQLNLAADPEFVAGAAASRLRRTLAAAVREAADAIGGSIGAGIVSVLPPLVTEPDAAQRLEAAVNTVRQNLRVTQDDSSRVLAVRFTASSPSVAAAVINTLFERYISAEIAARRYVMVQTNRWLTERAAALWPEVEMADRAIQQYRNENPLLELAQGSLAALQLNNRETELSAARQDLVRREAALDAARGTGFRDALESPMIQQLRDREADANERLTIIAHRLGIHHPDYIAAASALQQVRRDVETATAKVVTSMQQEVTNAARRVADLEARVAASETLAERSAAAGIRLAQLTRDADAKRRVYEAFMTRAAETQPSSAQFPPVRVISPAIPPEKPDGLPLAVVGAFSALAGSFAAAAVSILRCLRRGSIRSVRELAAVADVPCLGALPMLRRGRRRGAPTALFDDDRDGAAETLRAMRFEIQAMAAAQAGGSIAVLVTSSEIGDGKTTLAASFARLCAADGQRVLLVEADLRRPQLARALGLKPAPDLETALSGTVLLTDAVQVDRHSGLHCLTAAGGAVNPHKLFRSAGFASLLLRARRTYDLIVLDSPPVLYVADPLLIAGMSDVILFVVRWDRTPRALVAEGLCRIPEERRGRVATVLTRVPADRLGREDYYAGYSPSLLPGHRTLALIPPRQKAAFGGPLRRGPM